MLEKVQDVVFSNGGIVFVNFHSDNVTSFSDNMGLVNVNYTNVILGDLNFDDDDSKFIINAWLMIGVIDINKARHVQSR